MSRRSAARASAESRRCPKCNRKSAIKREALEGQVVAYCTYNDCDYESSTFLNP